MILLCFLIAILACPTAAFSAGIEVPLTVTETAGIGRHQWPVTAGVPIPRGALKSLEKLQILDSSGRFVPARFAVASRWWDDNSIQWVHCDFSATVPAGGKSTYQLREVASLPEFPSPIGFIPRGKDFEVITGPLRLVLGGNSNQLLDQVWVDEGWGYNFNETTKILDSGNFDLVTKSGGQDYRTSHWAQNRIELEEHSALRAVVRMSGSFALAGQKERRLDYLARLTVFGGKTYFKLDLTLLNRRGAPELRPEDVRLSMKLNLNPDQKFAFGTDSGELPGDFSRTREAALWQYAPDRYRYVSPGAKSDEEAKTGRSSGWADLSDDTFGLAIAVRWFWQLYPKSFSARNDGTLSASLFSSSAPSEVMRTGSAQTHEMLLHFHGKRQWASGQVKSVLLGFQNPLYATAPPRWYSRETLVLGRLLEFVAAEPRESEKPQNSPTLNPEFSGYPQKLENWFFASRNALLAPRMSEAGYRVFRFGDPTATEKKGPIEETWQNASGMTHALYTHFFRTGDLKSLAFAEETLARIADEGMAADPGLTDREVELPADSMALGEIEGLFDSYAFTQNRRFLDAARLLLAQGLRQATSGGVRAPAGVASILLAVTRAFEVTGDRRWLDSARWLANVLAIWQDGDIERLAKSAPLLAAKWNEGLRGGLGFSAGESGFAMRVLQHFGELTGDKSWMLRSKRAAEWTERNPQEWDGERRRFVKSPIDGLLIAPALAALFEETKERKYLDWARDAFLAALEAPEPISHPALFGRSFLAGQQFLWFLSNEFPATPKRDVSLHQRH